jgi:GAF domain-containing protein
MDWAAPAPPPVPRPPDDAARLAVLRSYAVLDTEREQQYEDLVTLAAAVCATSMAAISLVDDDRQWFKARLGLDVPETSREVSFCAHAILEPDTLLEVPDATADPRFAANPLVAAEGGVRLYAGTPLVTEDDQALGALLCVIDDHPRRLTDDQRAALEAVGRQVVAQLELRRTLLDVALSEQRVRASEARYRHLSLHDASPGWPSASPSTTGWPRSPARR